MRTRLVEQYMPGVKQFGGAASELRAAERDARRRDARARAASAGARRPAARGVSEGAARSPRRLEPRSRARRRRTRGRLYVWNRPPSARRAPNRRRAEAAGGPRRVASDASYAASSAEAGPSLTAGSPRRRASRRSLRVRRVRRHGLGIGKVRVYRVVDGVCARTSSGRARPGAYGTADFDRTMQSIRLSLVRRPSSFSSFPRCCRASRDSLQAIRPNAKAPPSAIRGSEMKKAAARRPFSPAPPPILESRGAPSPPTDIPSAREGRAHRYAAALSPCSRSSRVSERAPAAPPRASRWRCFLSWSSGDAARPRPPPGAANRRRVPQHQARRRRRIVQCATAAAADHADRCNTLARADPRDNGPRPQFLASGSRSSMSMSAAFTSKSRRDWSARSAFDVAETNWGAATRATSARRRARRRRRRSAGPVGADGRLRLRRRRLVLRGVLPACSRSYSLAASSMQRRHRDGYLNG